MKNFSPKLLCLLFPLLLSVQVFAEDPATDETFSVDNAQQGEIRRGVAMDANDGKSRYVRFLESRIKKIEPSLVGDPEKIDVYINFFHREMISDRNLFLFDISGEYHEDKDVLKLTGYVEYEEHATTFLNMLEAMGLTNIDANIEILPDSDLGEQNLGIVRSPNVLAYNRATKPRETMTDGVMGDVFFLLKEIDDHYLAHAPDGYVCYVAKDSIIRIDAATYKKEFQVPTFITNETIAVSETTIPPGAQFRLKSAGPTELVIMTPDGDELTVKKDSGRINHPLPNPTALAALETSKSFLGTPYVWGGKSVEGVDCSGLIQSAYAANGINMPRDAYMQAFTGRLTATRYNRELLMPGDLLYFLNSSGRISHTAIYVGDDIMIEAVGGGVKYTSLNPEHENYSETRDKRLCFAKRVMR